jgi:hypothetical protein
MDTTSGYFIATLAGEILASPNRSIPPKTDTKKLRADWFAVSLYWSVLLPTFFLSFLFYPLRCSRQQQQRAYQKGIAQSDISCLFVIHSLFVIWQFFVQMLLDLCCGEKRFPLHF